MLEEYLAQIEQHMQRLQYLLQLRDQRNSKYHDRLARLSLRKKFLPVGTTANKVLLFVQPQTIYAKLSFLDELKHGIEWSRDNFNINMNMHILDAAKLLYALVASDVPIDDLGLFMFTGLRFIYGSLHALCIEEDTFYATQETATAFEDLTALLALDATQLIDNPMHLNTFTALALYARIPELVSKSQQILNSPVIGRISPRLGML